MYRFSLSWSRLLPTGAIDVVNQAGVDYYNAVINETLKNGMTPMVTIYHWDLPQPLQDLGGFPNEIVVDYFEDYAEFVFKTFGDRVKNWLTINEPWSFCVGGYGAGDKAPFIAADGRGDYLCAHNAIRAHARAYRLYEKQFKATQKGQVGLAMYTEFFYPKDPNNADDVAATDRWMQFTNGWYLHPILNGDYPQVMKEWVAKASEKQGLKRSRLPEFSKEEVEFIKGTADFVGINVYTSYVVASLKPTDPDQPVIGSRKSDAAIVTSRDASWEPTIAPWFYSNPLGMRGILNWVKDQYRNPHVIITENGFPDGGEIRDESRVRRYRLYLLELLKAIHEDKCDIFGYTAWSILDNYEWAFGYTHKFGLYHVDFTDPKRPRTPKMSSVFFKQLIATRRVPRDGEVPFPDEPTTTAPASTTPSGATKSLSSASVVAALALICSSLITVISH